MKLIQKIINKFGNQTNVRIALRDPQTDKRTDNALDRYGHLIRTFVLKRRITKAQIWPKIHIIQHNQEEDVHLKYQKLIEVKKSMGQSFMSAIAKNDPSQINSAFVISTFCEDHFKQLIDEYVSKLLVCGKCARTQQQRMDIEWKVKNLYKIYYYGQKNTPLERQLQQMYLSSKVYKYQKTQKKIKNKTIGYIDDVTWTQSNQRVLQQKQNWVPSQPTMSDVNYRTYFQPLQIQKRLQPRRKFEKLHGKWDMFDRYYFQWITSKSYNPKNLRFYQWIQAQIYIRVMNYVKSTQFTSCLNVPHDYLIQAQMVQLHFWLIIDRLKKINSKSSIVLARRLQGLLQGQASRGAQSVNLKKSNVLINVLAQMIQTNNTLLDVHFNISKLTKDNPYVGIDALVWSIAFAQKIHRYSDEVYLFADYFIQNFIHMSHHTEQQILNGIIEFDPYLISQDYKQKIIKINPPMPAAEFQKQFNSNSHDKDYYYSKIQKQLQSCIDPKNMKVKRQDTSFSFSQLLQPFINFSVKYYSLKSMDHYNKLQQIKKQNEQKNKKGTWKTQADEKQQIQKQFQKLVQIKNKRRKINQQQGK